MSKARKLGKEPDQVALFVSAARFNHSCACHGVKDAETLMLHDEIMFGLGNNV